MSCTNGTLFLISCFVGGEPLEIMDWTMIGELSVNFLESFYLFGTVGATMDFLLKRDWIVRFPS